MNCDLNVIHDGERRRGGETKKQREGQITTTRSGGQICRGAPPFRRAAEAGVGQLKEIGICSARAGKEREPNQEIEVPRRPSVIEERKNKMPRRRRGEKEKRGEGGRRGRGEKRAERAGRGEGEEEGKREEERGAIKWSLSKWLPPFVTPLDDCE